MHSNSEILDKSVINVTKTLPKLSAKNIGMSRHINSDSNIENL